MKFQKHLSALLFTAGAGGLILFVFFMLIHAYSSAANPTELFSAESSRYPSLPILMYHYLSKVPADQKYNAVRQDLSVSPAHFEEQLQWLQKHDYMTTSLHEAVTEATSAKTKSLKKPVVLTFDDGYADAYENAFPLLQKYGMTGSFAIITSRVGTPGYLTWDEISEMHRAGMEFSSHTVSHKDLSIVSARMVDEELRNSKKTLEEKLGTTINVLVYPSGKYNKDVTTAAKKWGYKAARTTNPGVLKASDSPYALPVFRIRGAMSLEKFAALFSKSTKAAY